MKKDKINRMKVYMLSIIFLTICAAVFSVQAKESAEQKKVIKVAYLLSPGYQEGGEGEYKTGQGYEYLQKIASYAGWTYEYIYGDFDELLQKLVNGEVDIMGDLSYTEERAKLISYGKYEQGRESFYLYVNEDESTIQVDDLTTLDGKKIGVSNGSYQESLWDTWCEENGVHCEKVEFTNKDERENALNSGIIDATIGSLMSNRNENTKNWRSLFSFGDAPYFFAVNKNKPELLKELNYAQGKILNDDPYYNEDLMKQYLPNGILSQSQLDRDEENWIEQHKEPLRIGCLDDYLPISDMNENGSIKGVVKDVADAIQNNFKKYHIKFDITAYTDYNQMIKDLKAGKIDIAAPVYGDYWNADQEEISLTRPFMTTTMLYLQYGKQPQNNAKKIGININSPLQVVYAKIHYSAYEQIFYSSMKEIAKALRKGDIDAALSTACNYHVDAILDNSVGELNRSTLPNNVNVTMAVSRDNPELMSVLNRGIYSIGDDIVYDSLTTNSNVDKKITFIDYVYENPVSIMIAACIIVGLAIAIIMTLMVIVVRLRNANKRASTDAMTGLLNKVSMHDRVKEELHRGGVFFMVDIDNFKKINDVLGHEAGDEVIGYLAEALRRIFRSEDLVGRFGGDEFMVFLPGIDASDELIRNKVSQIQNSMSDCELFTSHQEIFEGTVSMGVIIVKANNNYTYTDVFRKADAALYEAKNNGKNTFVMVRY